MDGFSSIRGTVYNGFIRNRKNRQRDKPVSQVVYESHEREMHVAHFQIVITDQAF